MATVDVVIPCYNYARYLPRCVNSVLSQRGVEVRILIIDDTSTDESATVGAQLAAADARIEFRRHPQNRGHIATYNEGLIDWASADYSLLLSADDGLVPGALQRAVTVFEAAPDVGLVYGLGRVIRHDDDFSYEQNDRQNEWKIVSGNEFLKLCCEVCFNPVPTPTAVVRTRVQQKLGGYRSDQPHTGDLGMWMRFARHGGIGVVRAVQGEYRWHGGNMGMAYYTRVLSDRREFAQTCTDLLQPLSAAVPEALDWLRSMHENLLDQAYTQAKLSFDAGERERYSAWMGFADELSAKLPNSRKPRRLRAREICGRPLWNLFKGAHRFLTRAKANPAAASLVWQPEHGDISGWWPAQPSVVSRFMDNTVATS